MYMMAVLRILHNLNETDFRACGEDAIDIHFQVHIILNPQSIENTQNLKN